MTLPHAEWEALRKEIHRSLAAFLLWLVRQFCKPVKRHWLHIACRAKIHRISRSQTCDSLILCLSVFASCTGSVPHPCCIHTPVTRVHKSCRGVNTSALSSCNLLSKLNYRLCCLEKGTCHSKSPTSPPGLANDASVGCMHVGAGVERDSHVSVLQDSPTPLATGISH